MPLTRKRFLGLAGRGALGAAAYSTFGFLDRAEAGSGADGTPCPPEAKPPHLPFKYNGKAVGVRGMITDPPHGTIPPQAVVELDKAGGHKKAVMADGFDFKGILYVNDAYSLVTGNPDLKDCKPVFRTVVTSVVNGVDVDGVVRATSIVASLESQQPEKRVTDTDFCKKNPKNCPLEMLAVGYFDNLTIRGYPVKLGPADYLKSVRLATRDEFASGIATEVKQINELMSKEGTKDDHSRLGHAYPEGLCGSEKNPCSIFSDISIKKAVAGIPGVTACTGGRIHVADLGDVILGRLVVEEDSRHLTMLRIEFNSPPSGWADMADVVGDGSPS
jgi:hypothetical protein